MQSEGVAMVPMPAREASRELGREASKTALMKGFLLDEAARLRRPLPVPLPSLRSRHRCCYAWWAVLLASPREC